MKILKKIVLFLLVGVISFSAFSCGKTVDNSKESNKALIKAILVGYDNDWLKASIDSFNELYKDEGYEVELVLEDSDIGSVNEIMSKKKNDTDLYFDYNKVNQLVESSYSIMREQGVCLLEDLSELLSSNPLTEQKNEESGRTIEEKFKSSQILARAKYTGLSVSQEDYPGTYAIPYATSTTGFYVNKKALTDLGYSTDDLLTTDAILDMCDEIVEDYDINDKNYATKFFPFAYGSIDGGGYPGYMLDDWLAQYMGEEDYMNFWEFMPKTGTLEENGYSVYSDYAILESLRGISEIVNADIMQPTSTLVNASQNRVFTGTANDGKNGSLMIVSGDWIYKEAEKNSAEYLDDVISIKAPMISALGMKLRLCGATHEVVVDGYEGRSSHCDACEAKLKAIVKLVDEYNYEEKTNAQIAQEVGVAEASVKHVREARGYVIGGGGDVVAFMPSYANAKNVSKLFLRHLFSNDWQKVFEEKTYVSSILDMNEAVDLDEMNDRERSLYEKTNSYNSKWLFANKSNKLRQAMAMYFPATSTNLGVYLGLSYSHKYSSPQFTAEDVFLNNKEYVELCWYDYLSAAGY